MILPGVRAGRNGCARFLREVVTAERFNAQRDVMRLDMRFHQSKDLLLFLPQQPRSDDRLSGPKPEAWSKDRESVEHFHTPIAKHDGRSRRDRNGAESGRQPTGDFILDGRR